MSEPVATGTGPDLTQGVRAGSLADGGTLVGRVGELEKPAA